MTLANSTRRISYTAAGDETTLDFPWRIVSAAEIDVWRLRAGVEVKLVLGSGYQIDGVGADTGGRVVLSAPAAFEDIYVLEGATVAERLSDYKSNNLTVLAPALNTDLDRLVALIQELRRGMARAVRLGPTDEGDLVLPPVAERANLYLAFDEDGKAVTIPGGAQGPAGVVEAANDGTEAAPGISFLNDPDTGLFRPAPNQASITAGGIEVMRATNAIRVGIGRGLVPLRTLHLKDDAAGIQMESGSGFGLQMFAALAAAGQSPVVNQARAAGVPGAEAAVGAGFRLGVNNWLGHDGTSYGSAVATLSVEANENFTPTAKGARARMLLTANGSTTAVEVWRLLTTGFGLYTNNPTAELHVNGAIRCGSYTVATVPSASTRGAGSLIYVSNESGGAVLAFSDGTNWRRVTDRAIIS